MIAAITGASSPDVGSGKRRIRVRSRRCGFGTRPCRETARTLGPPPSVHSESATSTIVNPVPTISTSRSRRAQSRAPGSQGSAT
jgi:hypothetical protein